MPTPQQVAALVKSLGDAKLVNTDASIAETTAHENLTTLDFQDTGDWYIVGGSHYAIVPHWDAVMADDGSQPQ